MKKNVIFVITFLFIVVILGITSYNKLKTEKNSVLKFNQEFEEYNKQDLNGLDVITLINKATSNNEKYNIKKNDDNIYILDDEYSIEIYVIFDDVSYSMERINNSGTNSFIKLFADVKFDCKEVTYHKKNGRIASLVFESKDYK